VTSCLILTDAVMIKHRIQLARFFLLLLSLGFATAEASAPLIGVLGRLIARDPFLEALQIDDIAHRLARVLSGAGP
jgi:hypothetical protein